MDLNVNLKKKNSLIQAKQLQIKKTLTIFWKIQNFFFKIYTMEQQKKYFKPIVVRLTIKQNNVFVSCYSKKKTIQNRSAGIYKIKISKKKLKLNSILFIRKFFDTIVLKQSPIFSFTNIILHLIAPKHLRKQILKKGITKFQQKPILLGINPKKSFNGCRAKKIRRKKFKKFRILK